MPKNWIDRTRPLWKVGNRIEAFQLRHLGVSPMALLNPGDVLLLETRGRRTGRRRFAPVGYTLDRGAYVIGGGAAGMATVPDWVRNLRYEQSAAIWIGRVRTPVVAQELTDAARDEARAEAMAIWPNIAGYEQKSGRVVPYFRLEPVATSARDGDDDASFQRDVVGAREPHRQHE